MVFQREGAHELQNARAIADVIGWRHKSSIKQDAAGVIAGSSFRTIKILKSERSLVVRTILQAELRP
jgi:hypothetical protein